MSPGKTMKLSDWARQQGIDYKTAYRWFRAGILPIPSRQLPTGTILVDLPQQPTTPRAVLYGRVSSAGQKDDLERQLGRLIKFAGEQKLHVIASVTEIGSGLNGRRSKLLRVLADKDINIIIVEHRDRLARFGSEYIEATLRASGRRLIVMDPSETRDDLVQDMIDVLTSFCARLYGRRAAKNRALRAVEALR